MSYYDVNKENDFKDEMLKLPIFQKNKMHLANNDQTPYPRSTVHNYPVHSNATSQVSQASQVNKGVSVNKKKAEFEKKIRKFIESDSPHKPTYSKHVPSEYSFEHDTFQTQFQQN